MKIAIFGDSFASPHHESTGNEFAHSFFPYSNKRWHFFLQHDYEVHNFAGGSTGPEWSYYKYLQAIDNDSYDKIIFIVSDIVRMWPRIELLGIDYDHYSVEAIYSTNRKIYEIGKVIKDYHRVFGRDEIFFTRIYAIVKDIRSTWQHNALILPSIGFNTKLWRDDEYNIDDTKLYDIYNCDRDFTLDAAQGDFTLQHELSDKENKFYDYFKFNHMTTSSHELLYQKIKTWVSTGIFDYKVEEVFDSGDTEEQYLFFKEVEKKYNYRNWLMYVGNR